MNDYKEKIIKINYKKNKKVSSIKTKNYLIYPEDIYFNKILIREFFFKFYPFFSTVPSMSYRDIQELNNFLNNIDLK